MSSPNPKPDMTRMIEALLSTPVAGQAVARTLSHEAGKRRERAPMAEMRARRAEHLRAAGQDAAERESLATGADDGASPWSRNG
jgi:hypothetical protein